MPCLSPSRSSRGGIRVGLDRWSGRTRHRRRTSRRLPRAADQSCGRMGNRREEAGGPRPQRPSRLRAAEPPSSRLRGGDTGTNGQADGVRQHRGGPAFSMGLAAAKVRMRGRRLRVAVTVDENLKLDHGQPPRGRNRPVGGPPRPRPGPKGRGDRAPQRRQKRASNAYAFTQYAQCRASTQIDSRTTRTTCSGGRWRRRVLACAPSPLWRVQSRSPASSPARSCPSFVGHGGRGGG